MIDIKLDANSQTLFVEHIKQFIHDNPILLQNIIEPSVNEIISDTDVSKNITDKITQSILSYFAVNPLATQINDNLKECIVSAFSETYGSDYIHRMVNEWFDTQNLTENIKELLSEHINPEDVETKVEEIISEAVTDVVDHDVINEAIHEHISDLAARELRNFSIDQAFENACESRLDDYMSDNGDIIRDKIQELMTTPEFIAIMKDEVRRSTEAEISESVEAIETRSDEWKSIHLEVRPDKEIEFINTLKIFMSDSVRIVNQKEIIK